MLKPMVAFLLLAAPPLAVTAQPVADTGQWTLASGNEGCVVHAASPKGTVLSILAGPGQDSLAFLLQNRQWGSLQNGSEYALDVEFDQMGEWEIQAIAQTELDSDGPGLLFAVSPGRDDGAKFLAEFVGANGMAVGTAGAKLDNVPLNGGQQAMAALAKCMGQLWSGNAGARGQGGPLEEADETEPASDAIEI